MSISSALVNFCTSSIEIPSDASLLCVVNSMVHVQNRNITDKAENANKNAS